MGQALSLESFEEEHVEDVTETDGYQLGYQEGLQAGLAQAAADAAALNAELVQSIGNIDFTYTEARSQLLGSLTPLLTTIVEKVLPHCVAEGFAGQLADLLLQAANEDANAAMTLHVHPSQRIAVEAATKDIGDQVIVQDDPQLDVHAAWIKQERSETLLNVDSLLTTISETLSAIHHTEDRTEDHG